MSVIRKREAWALHGSLWITAMWSYTYSPRKTACFMIWRGSGETEGSWSLWTSCRKNCLIPFISETFLLYPKQGMRKRNNFPFISETRGYKGENWFSFYFRNIRLSEKYPLAIWNTWWYSGGNGLANAETGIMTKRFMISGRNVGVKIWLKTLSAEIANWKFEFDDDIVATKK